MGWDGMFCVWGVGCGVWGVGCGGWGAWDVGCGACGARPCGAGSTAQVKLLRRASHERLRLYKPTRSPETTTPQLRSGGKLKA